jgi:hypothetical protein
VRNKHGCRHHWLRSTFGHVAAMLVTEPEKNFTAARNIAWEETVVP